MGRQSRRVTQSAVAIMVTGGNRQRVGDGAGDGAVGVPRRGGLSSAARTIIVDGSQEDGVDPIDSHR